MRPPVVPRVVAAAVEVQDIDLKGGLGPVPAGGVAGFALVPTAGLPLHGTGP